MAQNETVGRKRRREMTRKTFWVGDKKCFRLPDPCQIDRSPSIDEKKSHMTRVCVVTIKRYSEYCLRAIIVYAKALQYSWERKEIVIVEEVGSIKADCIFTARSGYDHVVLLTTKKEKERRNVFIFNTEARIERERFHRAFLVLVPVVRWVSTRFSCRDRRRCTIEEDWSIRS